ncbi:hypothetical protein BOX15_Mlig003186g1, partial [Macrostomum lignano]
IIANQSAGELAHEVQPESDGSLSLVSLAAEFPGALGLQYRCPQTGSLLAVPLVDGSLRRPSELARWSDAVYFCTFSPVDGDPRQPNGNSKSGSQAPINGDEKQQSGIAADSSGNDSNHCPETGERNGNSKDCEDLIVLGLPYDCQEQDLRAYFDSVSGVKDSLAMAQIKRDWTGTSRGFGFVRFSDMASQESALATRFYQIGRRCCELKIPYSRQQLPVAADSHGSEQQQQQQQQMLSRRVFIGGITDKLSEQTLTEYFTKELGLEVSEVFVSRRPDRSFAFVTFASAEMAAQLIGRGFVIEGVPVFAATAKPIQQHQQPQQQPAIYQQPTLLPQTTVSNYGANICPYYALEQPQPGTVLMQQQYQPVRFAQHQLINPIYQANPYQLPVYHLPQQHWQ